MSKKNTTVMYGLRVKGSSSLLTIEMMGGSDRERGDNIAVLSTYVDNPVFLTNSYYNLNCVLGGVDECDSTISRPMLGRLKKQDLEIVKVSMAF